MKKILFAFLSLLLTISIIYTIYYFISKDNNINKNDNNITIKEDELTTIKIGILYLTYPNAINKLCVPIAALEYDINAKYKQKGIIYKSTSSINK